MVNLFRQLPPEHGGLTAALLALLEHGDARLLDTLLTRAGLPALRNPRADRKALFPAPEGPAGTGAIVAPNLHLTLVTQAPGEPLDAGALAALPGTALAITSTGRAPEGVHTLSWEQVDRWLTEAADQFDPESRTGFLIRQFRDFLPEAGIEFFEGFGRQLIERAPEALATLSQFYQTAEHLFERLAPAVGEGVTRLRQSRPEDLLAGFCYSDYGGPPFGPSGFLRVALSLPEGEVQVALWVAPGAGDSNVRLRNALADDEGPVMEALRGLDHSAQLRLWSAGGEQRHALDELDPDALAELDWSQTHAGVQTSYPLDVLAGEGLIPQIAARAGEIIAALGPVLTVTLH